MWPEKRRERISVKTIDFPILSTPKPIIMAKLTIAIVGDLNPARTLDPLATDANGKKAAAQLGAELAKQEMQLLVYGGPFLESDVVKAYVAANPKHDNCITMWYTGGNEPAPFPEEKAHPRLFKRTVEQGIDWEVAFYRSLTKADGIILMGGGQATHISGQVAIGSRMSIIALKQFGGGAAKVWQTLSAGEYLASRDEIALMAKPWTDGSAAECVKALSDQHSRKLLAGTKPRTSLAIVVGLLFIIGLALTSWIFGGKQVSVWMLFIVPMILGGAGAGIRQMIDRLRGADVQAQATLVTLVLGLAAGGIAGILFVTAQMTASPNLKSIADLAAYAQRSIPWALTVGFVAGLTSDAVFTKLLGLDVTRTSGISAKPDKVG
jgi:type IV secretory pathway TrbD component